MAYDNVYSPWRTQYFSDEDSRNLDSKDTCIFCEISKCENPKSKYVFYKDSICYCVMNLYPYMPAHFMVIPHRHVDSPTLLDIDEWLHIAKISKKAIKLLETYGAEGINMGINIKQAAGAGIPKHLHLHFVPRFIGDTNFITAISHCRVYGLDFDKVFDRILELSNEIFKEDA